VLILPPSAARLSETLLLFAAVTGAALPIILDSK
jgi:hypothetical protein